MLKTFHMNLETERLIIRPLRAEDLHDLYAYRSDPEVCRYQGYAPATLDESRGFIEWACGNEYGTAHKWSQHGIELRSEERLIGDIGLKPEFDTRIVEFGISLNREFHGQGLAAEALSAVFDHLFKEKKAHRITALMDVENAAMIVLAERLGFRWEGHYKQSFYDQGEWRDELLYALLSSEWRRI